MAAWLATPNSCRLRASTLGLVQQVNRAGRESELGLTLREQFERGALPRDPLLVQALLSQAQRDPGLVERLVAEAKDAKGITLGEE